MKVKLSSTITSLKGRLGGHTAAAEGTNATLRGNRKSGIQVKQYISKPNRMFATMQGQWKGLTESNRKTWINLYGSPSKGFSQFTAQNFYWNQTGLNGMLAVRAFTNKNQYKISSITYNSTNNQLFISIDGANTGVNFYIIQVKNVSNVTYKKRKTGWVKILVIQSLPITNMNITQYFNRQSVKLNNTTSFICRVIILPNRPFEVFKTSSVYFQTY